jgi:hypothetical protein
MNDFVLEVLSRGRGTLPNMPQSEQIASLQSLQ